MEGTIILRLIKTNLDYDILDVRFNTAIIKVEDAIQVQFPIGFDNLKGIIINGRGPIWLYLILYNRIKTRKLSSWIAQFDPLIGGAVKVESNNIHDFKIDLDEFSHYLSLPQNNLIIAFIGPPHSGKSVFLYSLFRQLLNLNPGYMNTNLFIIKGCPDGEGIWSNEAPRELVKELRYKNAFSPEFVNDVIANIERASKSKKIIFIDCGGKIDDYNKQILSKCTHAVLISSEKQKTGDWMSAYPDIKYLAIVDSYLDHPEKSSAILAKNDGTYMMEMIGLDRDNKNLVIPDDFLQFFIKQ